MKDKEFLIGSKVKVINDGWIYSSFFNMAKKLNATNWLSGQRLSSYELGHIYTIKNYAIHDTDNDVVILIEDENGYELLIGYRGLDIKEEYFIKEEDFSI